MKKNNFFTKKINFSFSRLLDNNRVVQVLSLLIAVITWFVVVTTFDSDSTDIFRNVPINFELTGTTPESYGLSMIEGDGQTIDIKVAGKKYRLGRLTAEDFVVTPILTVVTKPGEYNLILDVRKADLRDEDFQVVSYPTNTAASFDYIVEETIQVTAAADKVKAAEGYFKEAVLASPDKVILKGPQAEITKIKSAVVESDMDKVSDSSMILEGQLVFYDESGNKLQPKHTTYTPKEYELNVQIYKHAEISTEVTFVNVPQGLDIAKLTYTLSHGALEVAGPKETIEALTAINLGEIDFRKINVGSSFNMDVSLPAGLVNVNNINSVTVSIVSDELEKKQLSVGKENFSKRNEPAGYTVTIDTLSINDVKLVGEKEDIASITAKDLIAVVDLQGIDLTSGKARVPAQIYCTGNKFVWALGEYNVMVTAVQK